MCKNNEEKCSRKDSHPSDEQVRQMAVDSYLIETGQAHLADAFTGECFPECLACKR